MPPQLYLILRWHLLMSLVLLHTSCRSVLRQNLTPSSTMPISLVSLCHGPSCPPPLHCFLPHEARVHWSCVATHSKRCRLRSQAQASYSDPVEARRSRFVFQRSPSKFAWQDGQLVGFQQRFRLPLMALGVFENGPWYQNKLSLMILRKNGGRQQQIVKVQSGGWVVNENWFSRRSPNGHCFSGRFRDPISMLSMNITTWTK